ncbi:MAG TPA: hypothetical protein VFF30_10180 [Nitrososphaerales archaeon]|nr:hypothetical protein [Nitrososphaerales archaeon]
MPTNFKDYSKQEYGEFLQDPNVKRWYNNLSKSSVIVADIYLRRLGSFCKKLSVTPSQFSRFSLRRMEDMAQDYIDEFEKRKNPETGRQYAPGYVDSNLKAIKSWAEWNRKKFQRRIKISNVSKTPTLENERIPTQKELARVLYAESTPLRTRVSIALMAFAGPRLEVQGDYLGLEGLRIKDFPELKLSKDEAKFAVVPTIIIVREELSKSRHQYFTFLADEGCEILKQYLERRLSEGEDLSENSPIISSSKSQQKKISSVKIPDASPVLRTTKIGNDIRTAMRAVDLPWRPYVFRSYFDTNLMLAESKGLVTHAYQQFWMGHTGDIEARYTTRKHTLPQEMVEDMRKSYEKVANQFLETSTNKKSPSADEIKRMHQESLLSLAGCTKEQIDKMDLEHMSNEEVQRKAREIFFGINTNKGQRVAVQVPEVDGLLAKGYKAEHNLPDGRVVMMPPF